MAWIRSSRTRSILLRFLLGATAVSLLVYIPYRYVTRPPEFGGFLGTGYALLFPLSAVLAGAALWASFRPSLVGSLGGDAAAGSPVLRGILGAYGGMWVLMGLLCVPSLTALAESAPLQGLIATVHMTAQHVFLGFAAVAVAWRPATAEAVLRGERPEAVEAEEGWVPSSSG